MGTFARHGFINRVTEMVNRLYYLCCNLALKSSLWQIFSCEPPTPSPTPHLPPLQKKIKTARKSYARLLLNQDNVRDLRNCNSFAPATRNRQKDNQNSQLQFFKINLRSGTSK